MRGTCFKQTSSQYRAQGLSEALCLFHVSAGEVFGQLHLSVLSLIYKVVMGTMVTTSKVDCLFPSRQISGADSFGV